MGVSRYLAAAHIDDLDRTLLLADELGGRATGHGPVALLQCGQASPLTAELTQRLHRARRSSFTLTLKERAEAQSDAVLQKILNASAVWILADNLFDTFMTMFATQLAFVLRARARDGLPVIGVGGGALALGGLLVANRVCRNARYELVGGLGWAPRVLVDGGANRGPFDSAILRTSVQSLPGLLGVDLRNAGGLRVQGPKVESVGTEPIALFGTGADGGLLVLPLEPGQSVHIAVPPFPPFSSVTLPVRTSPVAQSQAPRQLRQVVPMAQPPEAHTPSGSGRVCPMCHKVHAEPQMELAA